MLRPRLARDTERIARLYDSEVDLRTRARTLELDPTRLEEARALFRRADGARVARLTLLRRAGLL